jgi:hypothetical protein
MLARIIVLFFDDEDGGEVLSRNVRRFSTDYMTLYPRRYKNSSMFHLCVSTGMNTKHNCDDPAEVPQNGRFL